MFVFVYLNDNSHNYNATYLQQGKKICSLHALHNAEINDYDLHSYSTSFFLEFYIIFILLKHKSFYRNWILVKKVKIYRKINTKLFNLELSLQLSLQLFYQYQRFSWICSSFVFFVVLQLFQL